MKTIKKFKASFLLALAIIIGAGFMYKKNSTVGIGTIAPELAYKNPEGKTLKLTSLKGKMVLIDFWASWCGPCRRENPHLVKAYIKYKDTKFENGKGFRIYSYSLDRDKSKWENAIEKDSLIWKHHVSDLKFWNAEGAKTYNVNSIPMNYLIDGKGKIVAKNLRGAKLEMVLQKHVKVKSNTKL